jgi:hypothetical protein
MRSIIFFVVLLGIAHSTFGVINCNRAVQLTRKWWTDEQTNGNAFGPYNWVKQQGPFLSASSVYDVLPPGFVHRTQVGQANIENSFDGLGKPAPPVGTGAGIGVLRVTIERITCFEWEGKTHTFSKLTKNIISIPATGVTGANYTLPYLSDVTFNDDDTIAQFDEYIDPLCTLCLFSGSIIFFGTNVCTYCGL